MILAFQFFVLFVLLAMAIWSDYFTGLLPDVITFSAAGLTLTMELLQGRGASAALGALVGFGLMKGTQIFYRQVRGREGLGSGDAKLMLSLGALTGPWGAVATIGLGSGLALLYNVWLFLHLPPDIRHNVFTASFPFGPALIVAGLTIKAMTVWFEVLYPSLFLHGVTL